MKSSVTWLMRHPRANTNHSIERCFEAIDVGMQTVASPAIKPVVHVVPRPTSRFFSMLQNCWAARQIQTDIAHITGDIHYVLPFVRAKHRILTVHDVGHVQDPAHSKLKRWLLLLIWFKWPLRHCDTVVCVSQKTQERLGQLVPTIPGQKRLVIPAAIRSQSLEASDAHRFPTDQKIILQMGTTPNKNLARVWMACEALRCHLAIVGQLTEELNRLQAHSTLSHSLHTNVSDEELERLYLGCDAVAFISTHEGFGMPIIEAQVFGKPCVTSAIEPMKSHAGDGAILVDPENESDILEALRNALHDAELCERIIDKGRVNVHRFSGDEVARQHVQLYRELPER